MRLMPTAALMLTLASAVALAQAPGGAPSGGSPSGAATPGTSPGAAPAPSATPGLAPAAPANPALTRSGGAPRPGESQPEALGGSRPQPGGADPSAQSRDNRTGKNALNDEYADCMRLWEPATHMTKQEWSRTCRRVQSRLNAVQIK
jgi:hypothetical protein